MTRGHGWSLTITMRGTFTPYSLPAFTGAFDLTPLFLKLVKRRFLSLLAASRILSSLFNASPCLRVQVAVSFSEFPLVIGLPSSASAIAYPILFGAFFGTITMSDFSLAYMSGLWPRAFPDRSARLLLLTDTNEISRFSNIERPRMHRFLDSAGSVRDSLINAARPFCLSLRTNRLAPRKGDFGAQ